MMFGFGREKDVSRADARDEAVTIRPKLVQWRALTSLVILLAFLVLATTGLILYVAPQGSVANRTGWSVLGLSKQQWIAIHTTMALLFLVTTGFHVYFNWQTLLRYLVFKRKLHLKREMIVAVVLVSVVFAGAALGIPPFSVITTFNSHGGGGRQFRGSTLEDLREAPTPGGTLEEQSAGTGRGHGAGWGRQSVQSICESNGVALEEALDALRRQGFAANADTTLRILAEQKGMSPAEVRNLIVGTNQ